MTTTVTIQTGDHVAIVTHAEGNGVRTDRVEAHTTITTHIWQGKGLTICEESDQARGVGVNGGVLPQAADRIEVLPLDAQYGVATSIDRDQIGRTLEDDDAFSAAHMPAAAQRVSLHVLRDQITKIELLRPTIAPTLTIAVLTTVNGWSLVGKSACADPKAYDADKGVRFAIDDALRQLWGPHAYLLRQRLHDTTEKAA